MVRWLPFCRHVWNPARSKARTTSFAGIAGSLLPGNLRTHLNESAQDGCSVMALRYRLPVGSQIFQMKFDRFAGVAGRVRGGFTIGNAARERRHDHGVAAFFHGNQVDLVGRSRFRSRHTASILRYLTRFAERFAHPRELRQVRVHFEQVFQPLPPPTPRSARNFEKAILDQFEKPRLVYSV